MRPPRRSAPRQTSSGGSSSSHPAPPTTPRWEICEWHAARVRVPEDSHSDSGIAVTLGHPDEAYRATEHEVFLLPAENRMAKACPARLGASSAPSRNTRLQLGGMRCGRQARGRFRCAPHAADDPSDRRRRRAGKSTCASRRVEPPRSPGSDHDPHASVRRDLNGETPLRPALI
jgi:hypothetical protein